MVTDNSNGKGDRFRPTNRKQYEKNWNNINWSPKKKRELKSFTKKEYKKLLDSGFLWELYPDATGNYKKDCLE